MRADDGRADAMRVHGGLVDAELRALRVDPEAVLDVSVNVNPYGPCAAVIDAIRAAPVDRYPDPTALPARRAIAAHLGVEVERIVVGNGAVDLLWTAARALVGPGDTALVVEPAFSELGAAAQTAGARVVAWQAREEDGFAVDMDAVSALVHREGARLVYVCSPANPTGVVVPPSDVACLARAHPGVTVLFDQAFAALGEEPEALRCVVPDNVVCVRSLTKEHAIPGVRVGYALCAPALAARFERARPPWSTSSVAQAAAIAAIREETFLEDSRRRVLEDRRRLCARLRDAGLAPLPSRTLYFLLPAHDATAARARILARDAVLVRDCASFGLPRMLRVCARPSRDDDRLVTALARELR